MNHLGCLEAVCEADLSEVRRKEATYKGSWKKRGGVGAWMMVARKIDRMEEMMREQPDIFRAVVAGGLGGGDGTLLAEIRDLRRYLLLIESEVMAREWPRRVTSEGGRPRPAEAWPAGPENDDDGHQYVAAALE